MLGSVPIYLCILLCPSSGSYQLCSSKLLLFNVPRVLTDFGKTTFSYNAPWSCNNLQKDPKWDTFRSTDKFEGIIRNVMKKASDLCLISCCVFLWIFVYHMFHFNMLWCCMAATVTGSIWHTRIIYLWGEYVSWKLMCFLLSTVTVVLYFQNM